MKLVLTACLNTKNAEALRNHPDDRRRRDLLSTGDTAEPMIYKELYGNDNDNCTSGESLVKPMPI